MKKIFSAFMCIIIATVLTACGSDSGNTSSKPHSSGTASGTSDGHSSESPAVPSTNDYSKRTYNISDLPEYFKITGRWGKTFSMASGEIIKGIAFDNAANGLIFSADCEGDIVLDLLVSV